LLQCSEIRHFRIIIRLCTSNVQPKVRTGQWCCRKSSTNNESYAEEITRLISCPTVASYNSFHQRLLASSAVDGQATAFHSTCYYCITKAAIPLRCSSVITSPKSGRLLTTTDDIALARGGGGRSMSKYGYLTCNLQLRHQHTSLQIVSATHGNTVRRNGRSLRHPRPNQRPPDNSDDTARQCREHHLRQLFVVGCASHTQWHTLLRRNLRRALITIIIII
jgi:hypothetical protein